MTQIVSDIRAILNRRFLSRIVRFIKSKLTGKRFVNFENSAQYWEDRYNVGGNSGAGSYGRLAEHKAEFLNRFVYENKIESVVEFGCGDGAQLGLAKYPNYIGFDVSRTAVEHCRAKFGDKNGFNFYLVNSTEFDRLETKELAMSLDVIYHLVEDDVFDKYMRKLFQSSCKFVAIFAYDFDKIYPTGHERGREFSKWIETEAANWSLKFKVQNPYPYDPQNPKNTSQSNFFVYERN